MDEREARMWAELAELDEERRNPGCTRRRVRMFALELAVKAAPSISRAESVSLLGLAGAFTRFILDEEPPAKDPSPPAP